MVQSCIGERTNTAHCAKSSQFVCFISARNTLPRLDSLLLSRKHSVMDNERRMRQATSLKKLNMRMVRRCGVSFLVKGLDVSARTGDLTNVLATDLHSPDMFKRNTRAEISATRGATARVSREFRVLFMRLSEWELGVINFDTHKLFAKLSSLCMTN
jgi:hypothetical protein